MKTIIEQAQERINDQLNELKILRTRDVLDEKETLTKKLEAVEEFLEKIEDINDELEVKELWNKAVGKSVDLRWDMAC